MRVVVKIAGAVAISVLGWLFWLPAALGGYMTYAVVFGQSMQPTYYAGDFVVARAQPSYDVGDVVVFRAAGEDVIHRIISSDGSSGYLTQGDNNPGPDRWMLTSEQIRGKSLLRLPGVGQSVLFVRELVVAFPFVYLLPGLVVLGMVLRGSWRSRTHSFGQRN